MLTTDYNLLPDILYVSENRTVCATIRGGEDCRIKYMFRNGVHGTININSDNTLYYELLKRATTPETEQGGNLADAIYELLG